MSWAPQTPPTTTWSDNAAPMTSWGDAAEPSTSWAAQPLPLDAIYCEDGVTVLLCEDGVSPIMLESVQEGIVWAAQSGPSTTWTALT